MSFCSKPALSTFPLWNARSSYLSFLISVGSILSTNLKNLLWSKDMFSSLVSSNLFSTSIPPVLPYPISNALGLVCVLSSLEIKSAVLLGPSIVTASLDLGAGAITPLPITWSYTLPSSITIAESFFCKAL